MAPDQRAKKMKAHGRWGKVATQSLPNRMTGGEKKAFKKERCGPKRKQESVSHQNWGRKESDWRKWRAKPLGGAPRRKVTGGTTKGRYPNV